eukprot:5685557-Pyramimonas_sp.AAC.1
MPGLLTISDLDPLWPCFRGHSTRAIQCAPGDLPSKGFATRDAQRVVIKERVRQYASLCISEGDSVALCVTALGNPWPLVPWRNGPG